MLGIDRAIFFFLCALVFVLPASKAGVAIFSVLALVCFLTKKVHALVQALKTKRPWGQALYGQPVKELLFPLLGLVAISFLSIFWSEHPDLSVSAFIGKLLKHVLLYVIAQEVICTPKRLKIFVGTMAASCIILSLDGLWQFWFGYDIFKHLPLSPGARISASFQHANGLGAYLLLALPLVYGLAAVLWQQRSAVRWAGWKIFLLVIGFFLGALVLGLTYSRGAWIGLVGVAVVFFYLNRKYSLIFILTIAVFLTIFIPVLQHHRQVSLFSERGAGKSYQIKPVEEIVIPGEEIDPQDTIDKGYIRLVNDGLGGSDRLKYWRNALRIIRDNPWTGTGLNTYSMTVKRYSINYAYYAHNCYLQTAAELGIFGLFIFVWFLGAHVIYAVRMMRTMDKETACLWACLVAGFIGFLIHGFFDTIFYSVQHGALLWIFLGILASGRSLAKGNVLKN